MNKYRILIIDDEPNILETMKDCFTMEGYEVLTAENGQDGIEEAKSAVPDLIIVDIMLPDSDGNEVCRIIKEDCGMKIPVIVATSKIDAIDATNMSWVDGPTNASYTSNGGINGVDIENFVTGALPAYGLTDTQTNGDTWRLFAHVNSVNESFVGLYNDSTAKYAWTSNETGQFALKGCLDPDTDFEIGGSGVGCNTGTGSYINAGSTAFIANSSRLIKEHFQLVQAPDILEMVSRVPVYLYDFIDGEKDRMGLVAEDFHTVFGRGKDCPELCKTFDELHGGLR